MNTEVHTSFQDSDCISFRYIPRRGTASSGGSSVFHSSGTAILFSIVAAPTDTPANSAHPHICYPLVDDPHANKCEGIERV